MTVVKKHEPPRQQMQETQQAIRSRQVLRRCMVIGSCAVMTAAVAAAGWLVWRDLTASSERLAAAPRMRKLQQLEGVWGWKADFAQSCTENPQTISVGADGRTVAIRYAKPYHSGSGPVTNIDLDVVAQQPDTLVLARHDPPARAFVQFINTDTITVSWSNDPMGSSGAIARCS